MGCLNFDGIWGLGFVISLKGGRKGEGTLIVRSGFEVE